MNIFHVKSQLLTKRLLQLERSGRYEEALAELNDIWQDKSELPNVEDFDKHTAAEIIAKCGHLLGLFGSVKLIPNAQEKSKNLITEAYSRFQDICDIEKIAECENYLAMAYLRSGELEEAETWSELATSHNLGDASDPRLYAQISKSLISIFKKRFDETIANLKPLEPDFREFGDDFLKGSFYCNLAVALKNTGKCAEALRYFELAKYHHTKTGHLIYLGAIENNIAATYKLERKFLKARKAIDNAIGIFKKINDRTRYGFAYDTKALIYLDEGRYEEALDAVEKGVLILENAENTDCLVETYITKIKTLLGLDRSFEATRCLAKAVYLAENKIGEDKAKEIIEEYEKTRAGKDRPTLKNVYTEKELIDENIKLVLSAELSHYKDIEGVWMKNKHLESVGLKKGSLAIVVKEEVKRGDLAAILERETEAVSCGFYDIDFGIICLQGTDSEPQLFDESEIQILGKIVGVADAQKDEEGQMFVEPVKISQQ